MIRFENVSKSFRMSNGERRVILNEVDAQFSRGKNVGILGKNGAGKTTLIRLLSGVELPDSGLIHRSGQVSFPLGFASVFHPDMTGRENVEFIARLYTDSTSEIIDFVEQFADIGEYFDQASKTYSSGMLSKVAFGVCLGIDFDVYLVDEITEVGDQEFRRKSLDAFRQRATRSDVIIVSHNFHTLRQFCEVGAILCDGTLKIYNDLETAIKIFGSDV